MPVAAMRASNVVVELESFANPNGHRFLTAI
jgi:hypothetical protein